jgi:TolB-like protein
MSTPAQPETLADTMTDALITALAQCTGLRVLSRVSSLAYKGRRSLLPDIADDLGVEWVLVASIARAGHEVRINAQLVEASHDENHWARSFTRPARRILSVQTEVAGEIAAMVQSAVASPRAGAPRE